MMVTGCKRPWMPAVSKWYAAPEQYGSAQTDPRSDIYALGRVLLYLLTGRDDDSAPTRNSITFASATEPLVYHMIQFDPEKRLFCLEKIEDNIIRDMVLTIGAKETAVETWAALDKLGAYAFPFGMECLRRELNTMKQTNMTPKNQEKVLSRICLFADYLDCKFNAGFQLKYDIDDMEPALYSLSRNGAKVTAAELETLYQKALGDREGFDGRKLFYFSSKTRLW